MHLHLHSEYSLLDGALRIDEIPRLAKEMGQSAVALTDHGNLFGAVVFFEACEKEGIKPIIGCEVYVAPAGRFSRSVAREGNYYHLTLLVENEQGYKNLCRMVSLSYTEGFYGKPRVDDELLARFSEGLICLSGCMGGYIPQCIAKGEFENARQYARQLARIFGKDRFYLELQSHGLGGQRDILEYTAVMAQELGLGIVATNDVHYARAEDARTQAVLMCIGMGRTIDDGRPHGFETDEFYFKSTEEMARLFEKLPQAIENTKKIADRCNFSFTFGKLYLPVFTPPQGQTPAQYLQSLAEKGLSERMASGALVPSEKHPLSEYENRIKYELKTIVDMGYAEYYLIVWDFVHYAKTHGIPTGPGRGSGAGSLVAFLIGITDVDSIRYELMFERFLNPERVSMPDFDVDFCYERRGEVIAYVAQKYGAEHVAQIITFGTLAARAVVRDCGRALGMSYADVDTIAKAIPNEHGITLQKAAQQPQLAALLQNDAQAAELVHAAMQLEGMPRHASVHAAGVVITDRPVYEYVPLALSGEQPITQFDMDTVAKLGLLKIDFLGLRYLTVIADAEREISKEVPGFSVAAQSLDDGATYAMLGAGQSGGVFQLESAGMRQLLEKMKPQNLEDIVAAIALYRPGPMDSIPRYLENRAHAEHVEYALPQLREILDVTNGCIVYQEQVMQICRVIAGYSLGRADVVRRAMSKKKTEVMAKEREEFLRGAIARGANPAAAERVFDEMAGFAKYAFNKSHAVAYAYLSYRTAYLLCHYPAQYLAALLSSVLENTAKMSEYILQAQRLGIALLAPDINQSESKFTIAPAQEAKSGQGIRFGLCAVKAVGERFAAAICSERAAHGQFGDFEEFVQRMSDKELPRRAVEALIRCGAFDTLEPYRAKLIVSYEILIDAAQQRSREVPQGQGDLFSSSGMEAPPEQAAMWLPKIEVPTVQPYTFAEKLAMEKEVTGQYFSGHLLDAYRAHIASLRLDSINEILLSFAADGSPVGAYRDKQSVCIAGIITQRVNKQTKKGEPMAFLTVEDRYGEIELVVFPAVLQQQGDLLFEQTAIAAAGELSVREEEPPKILLRRVTALLPDEAFAAQAQTQKKQPQTRQAQTPQPISAGAGREALPGAARQAQGGVLYLNVPMVRPECEPYRRAQALLRIFPGSLKVVFYDAGAKKYLAARGLSCAPSPFLRAELAEILGEKNVVYKPQI